MKRVQIVLAVLACACFSPALNAQMGMNIFKKPNIANIFHPVVGYGGEYARVDSDGTKRPFEMTVVGSESVGGKEAFWLEFGFMEPRTNTMMYTKALITKDDFQVHKTVFLMPGSSQPMEMPVNPSMEERQRREEEMEKWHSVGTETITVPAGTFSCEHWAKDNGKGDVWVSTKVAPMSLVKSVDKGETLVLTKVITDAKDHIVGTPVKFDPQMMRQMMMQQMNHQ
ncbi:MAG TPA: hypothetical protein VLX32_04445 [Candidatus Acidoferrum sp.]|nr:hypothetical protein [Candidatus Acidoferrum sp.]